MKTWQWSLVILFAVAVGVASFFLTLSLMPSIAKVDNSAAAAPAAAAPAAGYIAPPAAPAPVIEWRNFDSSAVVIPPAGVFRVGTVGRDGSLDNVTVRLSIVADQPVSVALVPVRVLNTGVTHPRLLQTAPCASSSILQKDIQCDLSEALGPWAIVVSDDRDNTIGPQLVAAAAAYVGIKGPAENLTVQNRVRSAVSMYACWEHCAEQQSAK